ncbi:aspartate/glutamate racemase family protein [Streptomyces hainanensis]|uniref:Amino acid racemase n=1 Tax=Streptomyces hainanensis TaxID=402648 RepID=A0A4R4SEV9_9ACTN|nr:amino acid racemase [Streptomyces hainanensis]TDC61897.1 amino acid racemase [Streptomyces hainanensis]
MNHHLGILAHSAEGAALCFQNFCQRGFRALGPHDHPDVTLDLVPLARAMPAWDAGDHDAVRTILATSAERLAAAGAAFFVCPDNTAHLALQRPGPELALPGLNLPDVVAARAARDGRHGGTSQRSWGRVGVLGTRFTMGSTLYADALARHGVAAEVPEAADRETVDTIIFEELLNGVFADASRAAIVRIIERLAARGCDAVALVCTELPLLVRPDDSPLPILDSTALAAEAAFATATGQAPFPTWRGGPLGR